MRSALLTFIGILLANATVWGQASQTIIVRNNKVAASDIAPEYQQIFPGFRDATIIYKGMAPIKCQANYNFLLDEIHFLNEKGEKLAISNPIDLTQVIIDNRVFIFTPKGYVEVIEKGDIWLVYKWSCVFTGKTKEGAYGIKKDTPGIYQMNRISFDSREWNMDVDQEAITFVEVKPYLKSKGKLIHANSLHSFIKAFGKDKFTIKEYAEHNDIDLNKEADLRKFVKFANSL